MTTKLPRPTKYHQPCWALEVQPGTAQEKLYQVWAPGEITHDGHPTGKTREFWQASWRSHNGVRGNGTRGDSLDEVLAIFPPKIAELFRQVIGEGR